MDVRSAQQLIDSSRLPRRRLRGSSLVLLGLAILVGALVADDRLIATTAGAWILPHVLIVALAVVLLLRARKQRELARQMEEALEAVQLRQWPEARGALEQVLRRP